MNTKELLGLKIKEIRKQRKLTQEKLSELVGVDNGYISKLEIGQNFPTIGTLEKIASVLDVELAVLFQFTDAKDIYYSIVGLFPFLESDFLKNGMFIILWIVLSFSEVYIIKVYTNLFILRMNKNKMMK